MAGEEYSIELSDIELIDYLEAVELERQEAEQVLVEEIVKKWREDEV